MTCKTTTSYFMKSRLWKYRKCRTSGVVPHLPMNRLAVLALAVPALHTLRLQTLQEGRGLSHGDLRDLAHTDLSHSSHQTQERVATFDIRVCRHHVLESRANQRQVGGSEHGAGLKNRKRVT